MIELIKDIEAGLINPLKPFVTEGSKIELLYSKQMIDNMKSSYIKNKFKKMNIDFGGNNHKGGHNNHYNKRNNYNNYNNRYNNRNNHNNNMNPQMMQMMMMQQFFQNQQAMMMRQQQMNKRQQPVPPQRMMGGMNMGMGNRGMNNMNNMGMMGGRAPQQNNMGLGFGQPQQNMNPMMNQINPRTATPQTQNILNPHLSQPQSQPQTQPQTQNLNSLQGQARTQYLFQKLMPMINSTLPVGQKQHAQKAFDLLIDQELYGNDEINKMMVDSSSFKTTLDEIVELINSDE